MDQFRMNPELLVEGLVRQNKLLKETIDHFPLLEATHLSTSCDTSTALVLEQKAMIEALLDLLDRQESRLILLEKFGRSVLLESDNNSIPIFRGTQTKPTSTFTSIDTMTTTLSNPSTTELDSEIDVKEWTKLMLAHLNCLKSFISSSTNPNHKHGNSKEIIQFIINKLDLEPLNLVKGILNQNRILILNKFPNEVPPHLQFDQRLNNPTLPINDLSILFEYPLKLYSLRHPKALLNLINSKFGSQAPAKSAKETQEDGAYWSRLTNAGSRSSTESLSDRLSVGSFIDSLETIDSLDAIERTFGFP